MEIAKVAEQAAVTAQTAPKTSVQTSTEKAKSTLTADNADKYVKSEDTFTPAYTKKSAQKKEVDNADRSQFRTVAQSKADHLASVVETIISHQASSTTNKNTKQIELSDALKSQIEEATGKKFESEDVTDKETALITGEQKLPPSVCSNSQRISQATTASTPILSRTLLSRASVLQKRLTAARASYPLYATKHTTR